MVRNPVSMPDDKCLVLRRAQGQSTLELAILFDYNKKIKEALRSIAECVQKVS